MRTTTTYEETCCNRLYKARLEVCSDGSAGLQLYDPGSSFGVRIAPGHVSAVMAMLESLLDEAGISKDS